jgi:putative lipoprotein
MRTINGQVNLPLNAPAVRAGLVLIEVRDTTLADAPSTLVAEQRLRRVPLKPNGRIRFNIAVPEVEPKRELSFRVHISLDGSGNIAPGDLLTTQIVSVPASGTRAPIEVPVTAI